MCGRVPPSQHTKPNAQMHCSRTCPAAVRSTPPRPRPLTSDRKAWEARSHGEFESGTSSDRARVLIGCGFGSVASSNRYLYCAPQARRGVGGAWRRHPATRAWVRTGRAFGSGARSDRVRVRIGFGFDSGASLDRYYASLLRRAAGGWC